MNGPPLVVGDVLIRLFYAHDGRYLLKYAIKNLILALGGAKPMLNAKYYFHRRKMVLREKIFLEALSKNSITH